VPAWPSGETLPLLTSSGGGCPALASVSSAVPSSRSSRLAQTAVHSGSYLLVTAAIAWVVFHKLGVGLLRADVLRQRQL